VHSGASIAFFAVEGSATNRAAFGLVRVYQERLEMTGEQVFGNVFANDRLMALEQVEVDRPMLGREFEGHMEQLPDVGVEIGMVWDVADGAGHLRARPLGHHSGVR
jgi:hypothetical protein